MRYLLAVLLGIGLYAGGQYAADHTINFVHESCKEGTQTWVLFSDYKERGFHCLNSIYYSELEKRPEVLIGLLKSQYCLYKYELTGIRCL